jgi:hypothetical protein
MAHADIVVAFCDDRTIERQLGGCGHGRHHLRHLLRCGSGRHRISLPADAPEGREGLAQGRGSRCPADSKHSAAACGGRTRSTQITLLTPANGTLMARDLDSPGLDPGGPRSPLARPSAAPSLTRHAGRLWWDCRSRRAGRGTGRPGVLPGRCAGTGGRGSRCTGCGGRSGCG